VSIEDIRRAGARLAQRLGTTRAGVLAIGRIVSPLQRQLVRRTGGRFSLAGRAPVLLLTTIGRRTGMARTVPLFYVRDGNRLVVCNVNPGFERPNPWTLNLHAHPHARLQIGRGTVEVTARAATEHELDRYWPRLTQVWPAYQTFYDRGGERSVFVLEHGDQPGALTRPGPTSHALDRWLYQGGRPNRLARLLNAGWARLAAAGIGPARQVTLEVTGRRTGKMVSFPVVVADYQGQRYLVSMLGDNTNWVRNVRAAGGLVALRHGRAEEVRLEEVAAPERPEILRRHLELAPGARAHIPIDRDAPIEEVQRVAAHHPVFHITARHPTTREG